MMPRYIPAKQWARNKKVAVSERIRQRRSKRIKVRRWNWVTAKPRKTKPLAN